MKNIESDLIIASDVFYFLDKTEESLKRTVETIDDLMTKNGTFLCVGFCDRDLDVWEDAFQRFSRLLLKQTDNYFLGKNGYSVSIFKRERLLM